MAARSVPDRYQKKPEFCNCFTAIMHQGMRVIYMCVALPVHVNDRGIHFVDGVFDVLQLTAQTAHDDANSLRSAIIKQLSGLKTSKIHQESENHKVVK